VENPISHFFSSLSIEAWMLWGIFVIFLVFYMIMSGILFYHWRKYGRSNVAVVAAELIFFLGTGLFVYLSIVGLLIFSL
jgi:hypothetical protein